MSDLIAEARALIERLEVNYCDVAGVSDTIAALLRHQTEIARVVAECDAALARAEKAEAEVARLRGAARRLLHMIEAQERHITPTPKRESFDDANSRDEGDQVFAREMLLLEAALAQEPGTQTEDET